MIIKLYKTDSDNNVINKKLTDEVKVEFTFIGEANIINPIIKIATKPNTIIEQNYCYIPEFQRYYFILSNEMVTSTMAKLILKVDVLESFKEDILDSYGDIIRRTDPNKYYDGGDYKTEVRKEHKQYFSDNKPEFEESLVLVTLGGAKQ